MEKIKVLKGIDKVTDNKAVNMVTKIMGLLVPLQVSIPATILIGSKDLIFKEEIEKLDQEKLEKMIQNNNFIHLLLQTHEACRRSKEDEKTYFFTKFFKTIVEKESLENIESNELEEFIYLFSGLSYREILASHKIREFTYKNPKIKRLMTEVKVMVPKSEKGDWDSVIDFLENKLQVKNINIFLDRIEKTGLIIKDKRGDGNLFISTDYFERIYELCNDLDNYLNESTSTSS